MTKTVLKSEVMPTEEIWPAYWRGELNELTGANVQNAPKDIRLALAQGLLLEAYEGYPEKYFDVI